MVGGGGGGGGEKQEQQQQQQLTLALRRSGLALLTVCQSPSLQRYLEGQAASPQLWLVGGRELWEQPPSSGILWSPAWQKTSRCWTPSPHDAEH